MRSILVLTALLALPMVAHAESPEAPEEDELVIEGISLSRDIPCDGQNVGIYGAGNKINLTGDCGTVIVHGSTHEVRVEQAKEIMISGADHTVFADTTSSLLVETTGHVVTANMATDAGSAQVSVNGAEQTLNLSLSSETDISIEGTEQVVNYELTEGAPEPKINVGGIDNTVNRIQ